MESKRGKFAESPNQIPASGWKDVLLRVKDQIVSDHIGVVAAGVAFYFFLALFPFLTLVISTYGLVTDPGQVEQHMEQLAAFLPQEAQAMLTERLQSIASKAGDTLGWGVLLGILISLWSANSGTKSLFEGVNIAYDEEDQRSFLKLNALTMLFTLGGIVIGSICAVLVIGFPALVSHLGLPSTLEAVISWGRWPLLFLVVMLSISLVYKFAPNRNNPKFKWVSWGSAIATTLWVAGSLLFSWYVTNFGEYSEAYGPIASVIILMLWFNLTSYIILLGAEINAELEHQTAKDTTIGVEKPLGERNAYHADHVAGEDREDDESHGSSRKNGDRKAVKEEKNLTDLYQKQKERRVRFQQNREQGHNN